MSLATMRKRRLAPNWRNVRQTIRNGEMNPTNVGLADNIPDNSRAMSGYIEDWNRERALWSASELVSGAISNSCKDRSKVREAAEYILNRSSDFTSAQLLRNAHCVLETEDIDSPSEPGVATNFVPVSEEVIHADIRNLRHDIRLAFRNPIAHLDLARAYLRNGQWEKAKWEALIAQALAPNNRYVTRSVVKCMLHIGDIDAASYVISKNRNRKSDPWVLAARLAIDIAIQKPSNYLKIGTNLIRDKYGDGKSTSELASAIATLEAECGTSAKSVRKYLRKSLVDPIDNAVAQARWLAHVDSSFDVLDDIGDGEDVLFNYEASTFALIEDGKDEEAYRMACLWVEDKPFSRNAVIEASNIAFRLGRKDEALKLLQAGIHANPGKNGVDLVNNAAYLYLSDNRLEEADKLLNSVRDDEVDSDSAKICLIATRGMREFRSGNSTKGEELYQKAVEQARKLGFQTHVDNASLNLISEKFAAGEIDRESAIERLQKEFPESKRTGLNPHVRGVLSRLEQLLNPKERT